MSTTGLEALDTSVQKTNEWLRDFSECLKLPDRVAAWSGLRSALHALRDRLPADTSANFAAQLPLVLRGLFYEGYKPSRVPEAIRSRDEFVDKVESGLAYPLKGRGEDVIRSAFQVLSQHVTAGETRKIHDSLPEQIRELWPTN